MICETLKVVDGGGHKVINKSDFDPKVHKEWKETAAAKKKREAAEASAE